jgi:hypothetical protein
MRLDVLFIIAAPSAAVRPARTAIWASVAWLDAAAPRPSWLTAAATSASAWSVAERPASMASGSARRSMWPSATSRSMLPRAVEIGAHIPPSWALRSARLTSLRSARTVSASSAVTAMISGSAAANSFVDNVKRRMCGGPLARIQARRRLGRWKRARSVVAA